MVRKFATTLLTTLVALAGMAPAFAQTGPSGPISPTPAVIPLAPPAPAMGALSEDALVDAIRALDPNFKVTTTPDGKGKLYNFTVVRDGWKYELRVTSFANDLWLEAILGKPINNPSGVPSTMLAKLLEINYKIGPAHFALNRTTDGKSLVPYLCRMLDRRLTREDFNGYVNSFLKIVQDTYPDWNSAMAAAN